MKMCLLMIFIIVFLSPYSMFSINKTENNYKSLISELKNFKLAIQKKDKQKLLKYFDDTIRGRDLISFYNISNHTNMKSIALDTLIKDFKFYFEDDFLKFIDRITTKALTKNNNLELYNKYKDKNCYLFFHFSITSNKILIEYGLNSKESLDCNEYGFIYKFEFIENKLKFIDLEFAG